jgi:Skp family chaperone for outer membrane proteins
VQPVKIGSWFIMNRKFEDIFTIHYLRYPWHRLFTVKEFYLNVMRIFRLFVATMFIATIAAVPTFAQRTGAATAQPTPAPAQPSGPVPASKIAFVNTQVFADEKDGITRYVNGQKSLDREFQPRFAELQNLAKRIQTLADEISKTENVAAPAEIQRKREEGEKLQRELKFKKEDAEAAYKKRAEEVLGPISSDIGNALIAFAKQRGITMTLDISRMVDAVVTVDPTMDVTMAFIAEYNSKNPATASTAAPGR